MNEEKPSPSNSQFDIVIKKGNELVNLCGHFHANQKPEQAIYHCIVLFWSIYSHQMVSPENRNLIHCYKPSDYRKIQQVITHGEGRCARNLFSMKAFKIVHNHKILIFPFGVKHVYAIVVIINAHNLSVPGKKMKYVILSSDLEETQSQGAIFLKYIQTFYEQLGYKIYPENIEELVWLKPKVNVPNSGLYVMAMIELIHRQPNKFMRYATTAKPVFRYAELGMIIAQLNLPESYQTIHYTLRRFDIKSNPSGCMPVAPLTLLQGVFDDPPADE